MPQDDDPAVPILCTECDTRTRVPLADLEDAIDRHNERFHDGDPCAEVDPAVREQLADLVAEDLGLL